MKANRRLIILLAAALFLTILCVCVASAEDVKPTGGMKGRDVLPESQSFQNNGSSLFQSMGTLGELSGPTTCVTGKKYSWTFQDYTTNTYEFFMCVKDGSYANPNTADVQYDIKGTSSTISYTFYFPGTYVLFCDVYDCDNYIWSTQVTINVTNGGENAVTKKIKEVARANKVSGNEFQTVLNLHDWVIDHCTYDYTYTWYSADSIFRLGKGVCNSYARAFTLLLTEAGIANRRVSGYAFGDPKAGHAWNAVRINDRWYLFDLTWDDSNDSKVAFNRYQYFAVPNSFFSIEHTAGKYVGGSVSCTSLNDNYYVRYPELWKNRVGAVADYVEQQNSGKHSFKLNFSYLESGNEYRECLLKEVTLYYLENNPPADPYGRVLKGSYQFDGNKLIRGKHKHLGTLTLPKSLKAVTAYLFSNTSATCVVVPKNCKSISAGAFEGMDIWEIRIPGVDTTIEPGALPENPLSYIIMIAPAGSEARKFAAAHPDRYIVE